MNDTIASEGLAEAPGNAPPAAEAPAELSEHQVQHIAAKILDEGLEELSYDEYKQERKDREDAKRAPLDADRLAARNNRGAEINQIKAAREADRQAALDAQERAGRYANDDEIEEIASYREAIAHVHARSDPYLQERPEVKALLDHVGTNIGQFSDSVVRALAHTPYVGEFSEMVARRALEDPTIFDQLDAADPRELREFIAEFNGYHRGLGQARQQQRPAPTVSKAPAPVRTVSGRSHAHAKTLEDMSYEEYRAHRMKQINRGRR